MVINCRQQNKQTVQSSWPIVSIAEVFDTLGGSAYVNSIHMRVAIYQVLREESCPDQMAISKLFESFE